MNLATKAAKPGAAVAFFSLEMGAEQLVQRILCSEARVNLSKLRSGFIAEGDWGALAEASGKLSQLDMFIRRHPGPFRVGGPALRGAVSCMAERGPKRS